MTDSPSTTAAQTAASSGADAAQLVGRAASDPAAEAAALATALRREVERQKRRGRRHVDRVEFPDTPRKRPASADSRRPQTQAARPEPPPGRAANPPTKAAPRAPHPPEEPRFAVDPSAAKPQPRAKRETPPQRAAHQPPAIPKPTRLRAPAPLTVETLRARISVCIDCGLSAGPRASGAIPGSGSRAPRLILVSDFADPAARARGKVFGPEEGQLIGRLITGGFGLGGADVHSTNAVKCPLGTGQRPSPAEVQACHRHLADELALLATDALAGIVALGPLAATALGFEGAHNEQRQYKVGERSLPVVLTDHPRDMLADPGLKAPAWEALKALLPRLG